MKLLSGLWGDGVVPSRKQFGEFDSGPNLCFHFAGGVSSGLVESADDVDRCSKSRRCGGFSHQTSNRFQRVKQHAGADAAQVWKEAAFDQIVFGTVARIVGHLNIHPGAVGDRLKIILEDVCVRRVAAATIQ